MNWKRATLYTLLVIGASSLAYSVFTAVVVANGWSVTGSLPGWLAYGGIATRLAAIFLAYAAIGVIEKTRPYSYASVAFTVATLLGSTPLLAGQPVGAWLSATAMWAIIAALGVFVGSRFAQSEQPEAEAIV